MSEKANERKLPANLFPGQTRNCEGRKRRGVDHCSDQNITKNIAKTGKPEVEKLVEKRQLNKVK